MTEDKRYDVFHRTWWRWQRVRQPAIAQFKRVPGVGKRTYIARGLSYDLALEVAKEYNDTHEPGELSRKAELEEA
jgi:hypothetical protein